MSAPDSGNPYEGTDLWELRHGLILVAEIRANLGLEGKEGLAWFLPPTLLPGVTVAYGLPVHRVECITRPYVGVQARDLA